jgi:hypothetical protein
VFILYLNRHVLEDAGLLGGVFGVALLAGGTSPP